MYNPPTGYADLLADAEGRDVSGDFFDLDVAKVGTVRACRPQPPGLAALAMSANPDTTNQERTAYLVQFVADHLADGELERLYFEMMMDRLPPDSVERVSRSLSTWGTARPYVAVTTLAVIAGGHWRTLRHKLLSAGIADPMSLGSMHVLLDFAESLVVESYKHSGDPMRELSGFYRRLYGPTPEAAALNGDGYDPVPAGFAPEEVEASFDAFARAAR